MYEPHILTMWAIKAWYKKYDKKHKALYATFFCRFLKNILNIV